ncbi:unnamed protein product [Parnassius apollo]|uniref:(apollo) hypothetical protein n=1 Tax=Parnassius apollo TaxID=110799 RepID=A0A8S3W2C3_PARAO|nr:unnamed protein product [Parnassius apollo]
MSKKYKTTGRGHRMINLVLQSEFADDNTDRVASVAAAASLKSPPHFGDLLITPDDLGLINLESISPISETPSLLLSPTTTADIMPILFSSDDEEEPLVISTRAIVHSNLEGLSANNGSVEFKALSTSSSQNNTALKPNTLSVIDPEELITFSDLDDSVEDPDFELSESVKDTSSDTDYTFRDFLGTCISQSATESLHQNRQPEIHFVAAYPGPVFTYNEHDNLSCSL